jgi:hypothetical protein
LNKNIIIIDSDSRHSLLIARQLRQTHPDFACESFTSIEDFQNKYFVPVVADSKLVEAGGDGGNIRAHMRFINLFIISSDLHSSRDMSTFLKSLIQGTIDHKLWENLETPPRVMLLDYEGEAHPLHDFQLPEVSDLVYKPIDWQLFSQKLDIVLGTSKGRSTHIYAQQAEFRVKIAKAGVVEQVADFGFVMRSPGTLQPGTFGYFFFPREMDKSREGVVARCLFCRPHPEHKAMFQNYFSFFGMPDGMKTSIRNLFMEQKKQGQKYDTSFDRMMQEYQARLEDKPKNFIIVEMNAKYREVIRLLLEENFENVVVHECSSYQDFLRDYLGVGAKQKAPLDLVTPLSSFAGAGLAFTVSLDSQALEKISPEPSGAGLICGHEAQKLLADRKSWLSLMDVDDRLRVSELVAYATSGEASEVTIDLQTAAGKRKAVTISVALDGRKPRLAGSIDFILRDVTKEKMVEAMSQGVGNGIRIDGFFLAGEFVGKESSAWLDALRKKLILKGMVAAKSRLPFFIFVNDDIVKTPEDFKDYGFDEFIYRPIDRSLLLKRMRLHFPFMKMKPNVMIPLEFVNKQMPVYVARDVTLEQVAEYGIQIRYPRSIGLGQYFSLFHPIFLDENGDSMVIRSYYEREHPVHKEQIECYFSFFGVDDGFLKRIRRWIREDYAIKSAKSEGST